MAILQRQNGKIESNQGIITQMLSSLSVVLERFSCRCHPPLGGLMVKDVLTPFEKHRLMELTNPSFEVLKKRDGYQRRDLMILHPGSTSLYPFLIRSERWHTHSQAEGLYVLSGECIVGFITGEGEEVQLLLQPGDYLKIPAHLTHWFSLSSSLNLKAVQYSFSVDGCIPQFIPNKQLT